MSHNERTPSYDFAPDLYETILGKLKEGVVGVGPTGSIIYWNHGAEIITGFESSEMLGTQCGQRTHHCLTDGGEPLCRAHTCPMREALRGLESECKVYIKHKLGFYTPITLHTFPFRNPVGKVIGAGQVFTNDKPVHDALLFMEEAHKMALRDTLTGLGNRAYGEIHIQRSLLEMDRYRIPFAVFFIDIDHFKKVNDTYGHETGDVALKAVGDILRRGLRTSDVVTRWGGEEFVCIILHVQEEQLAHIGEKLRSLVENTCIITPQGSCSVTISIGATVARSEDDIETLVKRADTLMYASKQNGRNFVSTDLDNPALKPA